MQKQLQQRDGSSERNVIPRSLRREIAGKVAEADKDEGQGKDTGWPSSLLHELALAADALRAWTHGCCDSMRNICTFEAHTGRIFSVALCALRDGRRFAASASHDRTVKVWSVDNLQLLHSIDYTDFVWRVFIIVDPRPLVIAFVSTEDKIQVSDLLTGETVSVFYGRLIFAGVVPGFPRPVVLTSIGDEDVAFLDVLTGEPLHILRGGFEKAFRAVVATKPSPTLVFSTWNSQNRRSALQTYSLEVDPSEKEVDTDRNKRVVMFEGDSRDGVTSLVVTLCSPPMICSGHYDAAVRLWCADTKQLVRVLEGHLDYIGSVAAWRGPHPIIVSASTDGTIKVWDVHSGELISTGEAHTRDVWAVAASHGPKPLILSGSFDRTLRVWDVNPVLQDRAWHRRRNFCLVVHPLLHGKDTTTDRSSTLAVLYNQSLCMLVASFL